MLTPLALRLSSDSLTAFLSASTSTSIPSELYTASRGTAADTFGNATLIDGVNVAGIAASDPTVSGDGLALVFDRQDVAGSPLTHLWLATRSRTVDPFDDAAAIDSVNSTSAVDQHPFLRQDGRVLYFASNRNPADDQDIYRASRGDGGSFDAAVPVSELNTVQINEYHPVVTADDSTIYFASKPLGAANDHIWTATRDTTTKLFRPALAVSELDSTGTDFPTFVTGDGCSLYFSSTPSTSLPQIYVASKPPAAP